MKLPIPNDWNGTEWDCVEIHIPRSDMWYALLAGAIGLFAQGRFWNEDTGSIAGVQEIGREVVARSMPFVACCGREIPPPDGKVLAQICGGMIVDECDEENEFMGVYRLTIDPKTGRLVQWLGPCCPAWVEEEDISHYHLQGIPGDIGVPILPEPGEPGYPELPELNQNATACDKANALMAMVSGLVDAMTDAAYASVSPFGVMQAARSFAPGVDFGDSSLFEAAGAAMAVVTVGLVEEVEDASFQERVLCAWGTAFSPGEQGISSGEYDTAKSLLDSLAQSYFPYSTYGALAASMQVLWGGVLRAIGRGDAKKITSGLAHDAALVCCHGETLPGEGLDPIDGEYFLGPNIAQEFGQHVIDPFLNLWGRISPTRKAFGLLVRLNEFEFSDTIKRMEYSAEFAAAVGTETPTISLWPNTSDHLENDGIQAGKPLVSMYDTSKAGALAYQVAPGKGHIWAASWWSAEGMYVGPDSSVGVRIQLNTPELIADIVEARFIYRVSQP